MAKYTEGNGKRRRSVAAPEWYQEHVLQRQHLIKQVLLQNLSKGKKIKSLIAFDCACHFL